MVTPVDQSDPDAFRRFALSVYDVDGVPAACVLLQSSFDLDVNLLLFGAYLGAVRGQALSARDVEAIRSHVGPWHREVVRPLRGVRQRLKTGPTPAPGPATAELRRRVQELELQSELIEIGELGRWTPALDDAPSSADAAERATTAMDVVVHADIDREYDGEEGRAVATIAAAAAQQVETD
jgi:uncharacterized protein (TIGR02444 family)